jgi:dTDP-4-amino-4,6-dideoxygalactose transaminase
MIPISKPFIGDAEKQAVLEVLESGMLVQGPRTAKLEGKFAELCGTSQAIATTSGTTALHVALLAHGIGPGDEVITTPFTFMASVNCILFVGAKPVFVDIEEDTFNINPALIEAVITPKTKAILPVHLYGYPCDMDALMAIARKHNLVIIEDACQAVGATYKGKVVGSFGTGCFSLYATKNIMSGEGGMITTSDEKLAQGCKMIRNHGMQRRYYHDMLGYNFRITDLHSAIRLDGGRDRDAAVKKLNDAGVGTGIFYPIPANKQAHLVEEYGNIVLPVTERMANEVISLPVHPQLSQVDLETIVDVVNKL